MNFFSCNHVIWQISRNGRFHLNILSLVIAPSNRFNWLQLTNCGHWYSFSNIQVQQLLAYSQVWRSNWIFVVKSDDVVQMSLGNANEKKNVQIFGHKRFFCRQIRWNVRREWCNRIELLRKDFFCCFFMVDL